MAEKQKYHFIGIGGIGMSALARILLDKQLAVSGSDLTINENIHQLINRGAIVHTGHASHYVAQGDIVVFNSLIQQLNPEYQAALSLNCQMIHRSQLLASLMGEYDTLAVAGTHGKTTTASLLTHVLIAANCDPTFALGGMVAGINGRLGEGSLFVAEADESDGSFLNYMPTGAIVTNIEAEHLDFYKTTAALYEAFKAFITQIQNKHLLFYCGDDPILSSQVDGEGISYGFQEDNRLHVHNFQQKGWSISFDIKLDETVYSGIALPLIGEHNALNGAAVFGMCLSLGIEENTIRSAFKQFPGVGRRCEKRNEENSLLFMDDYAHHPTEIAKTLFAVKNAIQERRLVTIFQPHRYTRTRDLLHEFGTAFESGDMLLLTDIYAAHETPIEGISAQEMLHHIRHASTIPCEYIPRGELSSRIPTILRPHDVLLTMGAGDINRLHEEISTIPLSKMKIGLIFGGLSCEHEISLRSCRFVANSLNRSLYDISYFGIDKEGRWITGIEAEEILLTSSSIKSAQAGSILSPQITAELEKCDLFIPVLHGTNGEDGTIQGFFEMLGKPYAGPNYRSGAICMDKIMTKRLVEAAGVKTPKDISFSHWDWLSQRESRIKEIEQALHFPVYVKPIHLGSSVGITPVSSIEGLSKAIDNAFRFDTEVMVEEGKINCRELEFAVLGNTCSFPVAVPAPGEKMAQGDFVDYEKKYGQHTVKTTVNPNLSKELVEKGRVLAAKAYKAIGCTGMTRVDFLLDSAGQFWLFEMNPIPGLQPLSLFPKIWEREGLSPSQLCDQLILLALERHRTQKRHIRCLNF